MISATMCNQDTQLEQIIRGHYGSFVLGNGENFKSFEYDPERPQVTLNSKLKPQQIEVTGKKIKNTTQAHFENWLEAMNKNDPSHCNNDPLLGAAAITCVVLGAKSYREGKVFRFDSESNTIFEGDGSWSKKWEKRSKERAKALHIPGWKAGDYGSTLKNPEYMKLGGPWINGKEPTNK